MNRREHTKVLIIGAGPVGLALANQLARSQVNICVVDQKPACSPNSRATGLQYRVSELLDSMDMSAPFLQQGISPTGVKIYSKNKTLASFHFSAVGRPSGKRAFQPTAVVIPQSRTEAILEQHLQQNGSRVEWNTYLQAYRQTEQGIDAELIAPDGTPYRITADWLVSCEGAHSSIRKTEGIEFGGHTGSSQFLLADVILRNCPWNHDENHLWLHDDGTFGALPLPGEHNWRLTFEVSRRPDLFTDSPSLDLIRSLAEERGGVDPEMIEAPQFITKFGVNFRMTDQFRKGRVFLAGDAAHIHSPTGAMGIVNGMQDALNLGWKLARVIQHGAPDALLDSYDRERVPQVRQVLDEIDRNTNAFFATNPVKKWLRNHIVFPMLKSPRMKQRMFGKSSQLNVSYVPSPLSRLDLPAGLKPTSPAMMRPGDRAPDILFRHNGQPRTLYACMRRHLPLILLGSDYAFLSHQRSLELIHALQGLGLQTMVVTRYVDQARQLLPYCLLDEEGEFADIYQLEGPFLCMIRPDLHLGLIQQPVNLQALSAYLQQLCTTANVNCAFASIH